MSDEIMNHRYAGDMSMQAPVYEGRITNSWAQALTTKKGGRETLTALQR